MPLTILIAQRVRVLHIPPGFNTGSVLRGAIENQREPELESLHCRLILVADVELEAEAGTFV